MSGILERPPAPARRRLDIDTLYKMADAGILSDTRRIELIDGQIIDMPAIGSPHAAVTNRLARLFSRALADDFALVSVQNPLRLDAWNEPEPDVMLLKPRADGYRAGHPGAADVLLLVEVADSSLAYDRGVKLPLYAAFGVPEVWIVDLAGGAIEVFRDVGDGAYATQARLADGAVTPKLAPAAAVDVAALLA